MLWVFVIYAMTGGGYYEEFGHGPLNRDRCMAVAASIKIQPELRLHAYCYGKNAQNGESW